MQIHLIPNGRNHFIYGVITQAVSYLIFFLESNFSTLEMYVMLPSMLVHGNRNTDGLLVHLTHIAFVFGKKIENALKVEIQPKGKWLHILTCNIHFYYSCD